MAEVVGFWIVAVALVGGSLGVVLSPNLFHAAIFYLPAALVATGALFWLLESPFLFGVPLLL
jgi:NADH:ubiquinone oxidoreductase subunit 6 (subunit J)